jgi:hypothetical protein
MTQLVLFLLCPAWMSGLQLKNGFSDLLVPYDREDPLFVGSSHVPQTSFLPLESDMFD